MKELDPLDAAGTRPDEGDHPRQSVWSATNVLIALNLIVFCLIESHIFGDPLAIKRGFGLIPRVLFGEAELRIPHAPAALTLLTSMFLHSGLLHIFSNMAFLFIFGSAVEAAMDSFFFLLFYLSCGVAAALVLAYAAPQSVTPYIGASGAISGVCAAYLLLYARSALSGLSGGLLTSFHAQAWLLVGGWILLQFYDLIFVEQTHVAFVAHVGGIVAGLAWTPLFKRPQPVGATASGKPPPGDDASGGEF